MAKEVENPVNEFQIMLSVKFTDSTSRVFKSPRYLARAGLGPELLARVIEARVAEWVKAVFAVQQ